MTNLSIQKFIALGSEEVRRRAYQAATKEDFYRSLPVSHHIKAACNSQLQEWGIAPPHWRTAADKACVENARKAVESRKRITLERFQTETLPYLFIENSPYDNKRARRLIAGWNHVFRWLGDNCEECGIGREYNGKPLTLQIDHKNGVDRDHRRENLRLLCPNCHSQTDTFTGRNVRLRKLAR